MTAHTPSNCKLQFPKCAIVRASHFLYDGFAALPGRKAAQIVFLIAASCPPRTWARPFHPTDRPTETGRHGRRATPEIDPMKSNGFEPDRGKRRGRRRPKGRGGFAQTGSAVLAVPAPPTPHVPCDLELGDSGELNLDVAPADAPEPPTEELDKLLIGVAAASEPTGPNMAPEQVTEEDLATQIQASIDEALLEELTRPDPPAPTPEPPPAPSTLAPAAEVEPAAVVTPVAAAESEALPAPVPAQAATPSPAAEPVSLSPAPEPAPPVVVSDPQPESAARQLAALTAGLQEKEEQLAERDQLVAALTAQLEEAANRLDRLHRAGADRAPRREGGSPSREALERQTELADQVGRLAEAWEQWQSSDPLAEIARRLDELGRLVTQSRPAVPSLRDSASFNLSGSWTGEPSVPSAPSPSERSLPKWEQMKAQLLGDSAIIDQPWDSLPTQADDHDQPMAAGPVEPLEPLPDCPVPCDLEHADHETLQLAVEERDEFISHLLRRLRNTPAGRREQIDWAAISNAPADLRQRLEELEGRFQELLRMEECEMSLERARLARERARLEQLRRQLEKSGSLGGSSGKSSESEDSRQDRRWLRVFGFGRRSDAGDDLD